MITIVCVSNNTLVLHDCLLKGLRDQTVKYELVIVDNTCGRFKSAAMALNHGAGQAMGDYLMFVHQDVLLFTKTWLEDVEKMLDSIDGLGVAGVAGVKDGHGVSSNILHCSPSKPVSMSSLTEPIPVQTLDECLFIIPRIVFAERHFDETVCDDWHLYGVDYCLSVKNFGLNVFVLPISLYHMGFSTQNTMGRFISSTGAFPAALPPRYYSTLKKLVSKHRKDFRTIYTTCGIWDTGYPIGLQRAWLIIEAMARYPFKLLVLLGMIKKAKKC